MKRFMPTKKRVMKPEGIKTALKNIRSEYEYKIE